MISENFEIVQSDVLIVGGGFGGLWAALRAAECGASVTLVDKSFAGRSGHSCFAGGAMMAVLPEDDLDESILDIVRGNDWLADQDMVEAVFRGSFQRLQDYESFGLRFRRRGDQYEWTKARGTRNVKNFWPENATAADMVITLRKVALARNVRIIDHVYIYDLAIGGRGEIAGALGVGMRDSRSYLFQAQGVILATNSGSFRGHHLACELQGTGPFMAFNVGARIVNPEFHYINIRPAKHEIEGSGILPAVGAKWKNARGDYYMERYDPELKDRAPVMKIVVSAAREFRKGNTPVCLDVEAMTEDQRETFRRLQVSHGWMPLLFEKCERYESYDPLRNNIEWQPAYEANKLGLWTDIDGGTDLPGLFAAGMARSLGINPFTGWSIAACTWSGYAAGGRAAEYIRSVRPGEPDIEFVRGRLDRFLEPLRRTNGVDPDRLTHEIQAALFPADVLILMSEPRLNEALERVKELDREQKSLLQAADLKSLVKCREVETMLLAAEMTLTAAIMRKETRENIFIREDYPAPDNDHWLKWIVARTGLEGKIRFSAVDIPFDRYRFRPVN